jgi:predicted RNA-binding protein (virulence factor B family)
MRPLSLGNVLQRSIVPQNPAEPVYAGKSVELPSRSRLQGFDLTRRALLAYCGMPAGVPLTAADPFEPGDVAFLTVVDLTPIGAFVDWGLPKQLLVPFAEQTRELGIGDRVPIGIFVDNTGRFAGTMKIREMLAEDGEFNVNEWADGEAWRSEPGVGLFVIVERRFLGLVPASEPHALQRGQGASFRIARVLPDGRIELSLRGLAHEQLAADAQRVLVALSGPNMPAVSDHSHPEQIRALFGLSKKAFKRAVGRLLKEGLVKPDVEGRIRPTGELPRTVAK